MIFWDALTAVSTAITALVIGATVIVGYRQIRVAGAQLEHLRRATQLQGTMAIFEEMTTPEATRQWEFVVNELAVRMRDPAFREVLGSERTPLEHDHPELGMLRRFEKLGTYVKSGLLDGDVLYDFFGGQWVLCWEILVVTGVIDLMRRTRGPELWENAQFVYEQSKRYGEARGWVEAPLPVPPTTGDDREVGSASSGTRTQNQRIKSPML